MTLGLVYLSALHLAPDSHPCPTHHLIHLVILNFCLGASIFKTSSIIPTHVPTSLSTLGALTRAWPSGTMIPRTSSIILVEDCSNGHHGVTSSSGLGRGRTNSTSYCKGVHCILICKEQSQISYAQGKKKKTLQQEKV